MQLTRPVLEMTGAPPAGFTPGRMLNGAAAGTRGPWSAVPVVNDRRAIAGAAAEAFAQGAHPDSPAQQIQGLAVLNLEIVGAGGAKATLAQVPFEAIIAETGQMTYSSERQQTPWHFLLKTNPATRQLSLSVTLNYAGLRVAQALEGAMFYEAVARGGEFRLVGRHPVTGGELPIIRGDLPPGAYEGPGRLLDLLELLALIEAKTGVVFTIPDHAISAEEANTIAATAEVLKTGHAQYMAEPWVSVSDVTQARAALESFAGGEPLPMALEFEGQVVVILNTHVPLGPVAFFCERVYITPEDLAALSRELEASTPESHINIRFTPFAGCPVEARYLNWLPAAEAAELRQQLPTHHERAAEAQPDEVEWILPPTDAAEAIALLESWYDEDAEEQRQTWERLKVALDEDRLSERKLFS